MRAGEGGEWHARVRLGGRPSAGAVGLEFPSKGIRRGTRRVMEIVTRRVGHILQHSLSVTEN